MRFIVCPLICFLSGIVSFPSMAQLPGVPEALRYMAMPPKQVADSLKKRGFKTIDCIGHPWKDEPLKDICLFQEKSGLIVDISPRQNGKSSEILYLYEGKERYDLHKTQLEKEGFKLLLPADVSPDKKTETWHWAQTSVYGRMLFVRRLRMMRSDGSSGSYYEHFYFDDTKTNWELFCKREPESVWTPGMKYDWSEAGVEWQLPAGTKVSFRFGSTSEIGMEWPGGVWSDGLFLCTLEARKEQNPFEKVRSLLAAIVPDRTDSLIFIRDKGAGVSLCIVESNGKWENKPFQTLFFAGVLKNQKLIHGHYITNIPAKGGSTLKMVRQIILATFRKNWGTGSQ